MYQTSIIPNFTVEMIPVKILENGVRLQFHMVKYQSLTLLEIKRQLYISYHGEILSEVLIHRVAHHQHHLTRLYPAYITTENKSCQPVDGHIESVPPAYDTSKIS